MKNVLLKLVIFILVAAMVLPIGAGAAMDGSDANVTVLFTHDLHSHFLPTNAGDGSQYGGVARLMTVINQQKAKYPNAILVDGGDFSMGSLFQTAFATSALELRMLGAMGYDATTFGNHEYDYLPSGLASMLNAAVASGERLPALLQANYLPPMEGEDGYDADAAAMWAAFDNYGVADYTILERGGVYFVIFGIMGRDSDACAPNSGSVLHDPAETAQRVVDAATAQCLEMYDAEPVVICLSHSGTTNGEGEDYDLAQKVTGIDLIISSHTHTTLKEPIRVGQSYIASAGEYGKYLGVVNMAFNDGKASLVSYELIPIDETVAEDPVIASLVETYKATVESDYLAQYGLCFDLPLVYNPYEFETVSQVKATQHESAVGNLYSDAYHWAAETLGGVKVDVALTAAGVIRESVPTGVVTVSDVFNAASLGVGTEGELIAVYVTGKDLKNALEVDASVQPLMKGAQLFFSGVEYSFNTRRMIFNKVDYSMLRREDGSLERIVDDQLYCVVTGIYAGQMLGNVEATSYGLLAITPRDAEGNPIAMDDLVNYVIRDSSGKPLKEWYAISIYLAEMGGNMDERYSHTDGRKVVYSSLNPVKLLRNANALTVVAMLVIVAVLAVILLVSMRIAKKVRRRKTK